jgi:hypothetical protein
VEASSIISKGVMALGLSFFFEKYFGFATLPILHQLWNTCITKGRLFSTVYRYYGLGSKRYAGVSCTVWWYLILAHANFISIVDPMPLITSTL